jgi:hypothetical protein
MQVGGWVSVSVVLLDGSEGLVVAYMAWSAVSRLSVRDCVGFARASVLVACSGLRTYVSFSWRIWIGPSCHACNLSAAVKFEVYW